MAEITVELADAPRDVLVFLTDHHDAQFTADEIADAVAPDDAGEPLASVLRALSLLLEARYVFYGHNRWWVAPAGRDAVRQARAAAAETFSGEAS